jgi:hypothetical protein
MKLRKIEKALKIVNFCTSHETCGGCPLCDTSKCPGPMEIKELKEKYFKKEKIK